MNIAPPQRVARGLGAASEEHCPDASATTVLQHVEAVEAAAPHGGFLQLRELDALHDRQITVRSMDSMLFDGIWLTTPSVPPAVRFADATALYTTAAEVGSNSWLSVDASLTGVFICDNVTSFADDPNGHSTRPISIALREHHTLLVVAALCKNASAVMQRYTTWDKAFELHRLQRLTARTKHNNALVVGVSDDELVKGRARDASGTAKMADTHVVDELALQAEHAHAAVATVGNCDVTVPGHEAQPKWELQPTVLVAIRPEAMKKSTVTAREYADAVGTVL
jgi:hypothetical protein